MRPMGRGVIGRPLAFTVSAKAAGPSFPTQSAKISGAAACCRKAVRKLSPAEWRPFRSLRATW